MRFAGSAEQTGYQHCTDELLVILAQAHPDLDAQAYRAWSSR
jgi:hypothetical protein